MLHVLSFLAMALFPLALAGYGGHLAGKALNDKKKRRIALLIVWGLASGGVVASAFFELLGSRQESRRIEEDKQKDTAQSHFQVTVLSQLGQIEAETDKAKRKEDATRLAAVVRHGAEAPRATLTTTPEEDPTVSLLNRAVAATTDCEALERTAQARYEAAKADSRDHDKQFPGSSQETNNGYLEWTLANADRDTSNLYVHNYKDEMKSIGPELARRVPDSASPYVNFDDAKDVMGVRMMCDDLTDLTTAYASQLCSAKKITPEVGLKALNAIKAHDLLRCGLAQQK